MGHQFVSQRTREKIQTRGPTLIGVGLSLAEREVQGAYCNLAHNGCCTGCAVPTDLLSCEATHKVKTEEMLTHFTSTVHEILYSYDRNPLPGCNVEASLDREDMYIGQLAMYCKCKFLNVKLNI